MLINTDINSTSETKQGVDQDDPRLCRFRELIVPDWAELDTVRRSHLPFVLWQVGDQPLLYHWLDYVLNEGHRDLRIYCSDRPGEVRKAMLEATLWPLRWEVIPVSQLPEQENMLVADRVPWSQPDEPLPTDGWSLISYWFSTEKQWYQHCKDEEILKGVNLSMGKFTRIDPSVKIHPPVWIGNHVVIGPNSEIGPLASIGHGAVVQGNSHIVQSRLMHNTYLGPDTELVGCVLQNSTLINLRHRTRVDGLDSFLAAPIARHGTRPTILSRIAAAVLYLILTLKCLFSRKSKTTMFKTIQGLELPWLPEAPTCCQRAQWLPYVIRGQICLFGPLPRCEEDIEGLYPEWQQLLSQSPIGVFSYADTLGYHSPTHSEEAVHAVYHATKVDPSVRRKCVRFIAKLIFSR